MNPTQPLVLAGDIGGTKTTLAVFHPESGPRSPLDRATYPSGSYPSLEAVVQEFISGKHWQVGHASFGVAGPVMNGQVRVTNLSWVIDEKILSQRLETSVTILNDLESIAYGLPYLEPADLVTINAGTPEPRGGRAVIAPGTGLGEAFLLWDQGGYRPYPSEGGHADFAPASPLELDLLAYLQPRFAHVSYERVCSGIGIPNIYAFLKDSGRYAEPDWLRAELSAASDPTRAIMQAAEEQHVEICVATAQLFAAILASEAGNLALKVLATGGVYLGGGISPRIIPYLKQETVIQSFSQKGRMSALLARVPVHVIRNPDVALFGAACQALDLERSNG